MNISVDKDSIRAPYGSIAKFWRERLMETEHDGPSQRKVLLAMEVELVQRHRLDEADKTLILSQKISGPAAEITNPQWSDDAEILLFADGSGMVVGLQNEQTGGLHIICTAPKAA